MIYMKPGEGPYLTIKYNGEINVIDRAYAMEHQPHLVLAADRQRLLEETLAVVRNNIVGKDDMNVLLARIDSVVNEVK